MKSKLGFSLVDLMVVISITGLLVITVWSFRANYRPEETIENHIRTYVEMTHTDEVDLVILPIGEIYYGTVTELEFVTDSTYRVTVRLDNNSNVVVLADSPPEIGEVVEMIKISFAHE